MEMSLNKEFNEMTEMEMSNVDGGAIVITGPNFTAVPIKIATSIVNFFVEDLTNCYKIGYAEGKALLSQ